MTRMIPKRAFWAGAGYAAGATTSIWAVRKVKRAAARYFFAYELPKIGAWLAVVRARDMTCAQLPEEAF